MMLPEMPLVVSGGAAAADDIGVICGRQLTLLCSAAPKVSASAASLSASCHCTAFAELAVYASQRSDCCSAAATCAKRVNNRHTKPNYELKQQDARFGTFSVRQIFFDC